LVNELFRNITKDFSIEFKNPSTLVTSLSFAAIATISISLVSRSYQFSPFIQSILLWLIMFFAGMNSLLHIFIREVDHGNELFLKLNSSAFSVYFSKLIFNCVLFLFLQIIITPLGIAFLQFSIQSQFFFIAIIMCGGFAISGTTTVLSAIVARSGGRGSLFTIISFPVLLPVLWVAISSTEKALGQSGFWDSESLVFLLAFSGMIIALSFLLIRFIWLDE